ncbi:hypothetical protein Tco_0331132 [Tanacetum coccineum]
MPPSVTNIPFTKPPTKKQLLAFIKTLGYDEDKKEMITSIPTFVAIRLHQPWRAIMSVLNRCLTEKDTSLDRARLLSIHRRSDDEMHSEGQDSPISKLIITVDGRFKFRMEIPDTMINDAIKKATCAPVRRGKGKGYMCSGNQEVNVPSKPKKPAAPKKPRTITVADNTVEQETVAVELEKSVSIEEQRLQQRVATDDPVVQSLLDLRKGSKESILESMRQERKEVIDTDKDTDDETDDAGDSDMDISDNDSDK